MYEKVSSIYGWSQLINCMSWFQTLTQHYIKAPSVGFIWTILHYNTGSDWNHAMMTNCMYRTIDGAGVCKYLIGTTIWSCWKLQNTHRQCDQMPGIFPKTLTWKSPAGIFIFCLCSKSGIFEKFSISKFSWNFAKFLSKKKTVFLSFVFCKIL